MEMMIVALPLTVEERVVNCAYWYLAGPNQNLSRLI